MKPPHCTSSLLRNTLPQISENGATTKTLTVKEVGSLHILNRVLNYYPEYTNQKHYRKKLKGHTASTVWKKLNAIYWRVKYPLYWS